VAFEKDTIPSSIHEELPAEDHEEMKKAIQAHKEMRRVIIIIIIS
jgi:hypothetical protein